ncbi:MAG: hydroxyacylglutathione hydrolase [Myxococcota bacterium]|nr:hydroxyacylglutathione hydrolase [Myxococcota bacterium]
MLEVEPIPLLNDNYAWLISCSDSLSCAVVDPSEGPPVEDILSHKGLKLDTILITHHHWDHIGGVEHLIKTCMPDRVIASEYDELHGRIPGITHSVGDGAVLTALGTEFKVLTVPGHTLGAVAYYFPSQKLVFTGDTLFTAGCGRLFEGTPSQMFESLGRLRDLPRETLLYCGHEYTQKNLRFATTIEPDSIAILERLEEVEKRREKNLPTVPVPLAVELETNPFLRADKARLLSRMGVNDGAECFAKIRKARDSF